MEKVSLTKEVPSEEKIRQQILDNEAIIKRLEKEKVREKRHKEEQEKWTRMMKGKPAKRA